jgi:drug/metabolite transporter (DMT)-like permease
MKKSTLYLLLLITVSFWGTSFITVQDALKDLAPVHFLFIRLLIANSLFFIILKLSPRKKSGISPQDYGAILFLGFIGVAGYFVVQYTALTYTTTVNAALIIGISPIMVALYRHFFAGDRLSFTQNLGIGLCFIGLVCLITKGDLSKLSIGKSYIGDGLMLINALMLASFTLKAESLLKNYDPFTLIAYVHGAGLILLIPVVMTPNVLSVHSILYLTPLITSSILLKAAYLGIACTVFGYYVWYLGIRELGPSKTAVFSYLNPLVAALTARFLHQETLPFMALLGGLYIILGVMMCNHQFKRSTKAVKSPVN